MKKLYISLTAAAFVLSVWAVDYTITGYGQTVTASGTAQSVAMPAGYGAKTVSIHNGGTNTVYVLANTTTSAADFQFETNAIAVFPGFPYTFPEKDRYESGKYVYTNVVVATTNLTADVSIAFK